MDYTNESNEDLMFREPLPDYGKRKLTIEEYLEFERSPSKNMNIIRARYLQ